MTEIWTKWENRVVNGIFPLRRFLGRSDHSVVFLTEHRQGSIPDAAIKLVPADPALTEAQLACWRTASALSHPHLIKLFDTGRCRLGGHPFLFVVMEYAEQTLAQVLAKRPLTHEEVRELLPPTLEALAYLHGKNLVHGQLKPPNFLVVGDQLKLASDNIHPAGKAAPSIAKRRTEDPPEAPSAGMSAAGDIWGLGVTMVEALTQRPPSWADERYESLSLPAALAPDLVDIARRCLSRNPGARPSLADIDARLRRASNPPEVAAPVPGVPETAAPEASNNFAPPRAPLRRLSAWAIAGLLVVSTVVWLSMRHRQPDVRQAAQSTAQNEVPADAAPMKPRPPTGAHPPTPAMPPATTPSIAPKPDAPSGSVLHEEIPSVSRRARESIHGNIKVSVRVTVDRSGKVVGAQLENRGPSKYFARLAKEAAGKWRFTADPRGSREWLLWFEFSRSGVSGKAAPRRGGQ
ncbi:MAG TPA: protein kinase [Steroidobacteraceae bacterium]|nr:protein kinase [Steroidobacteraceae bacterium]